MITVTDLWRHPIKSHGREALTEVTLVPGAAMPWDRHWAVTHDRTKFDPDNPDWVMCRNFVIGVVTPGLAGLWARFDEAAGVMHLRHVGLGEISFDPDQPDDAARFLDWVRPLSEGAAMQPAGVARLAGRGFTDSAYPSVSVMNHASHAAVSARLGGALEPERWRGNIWLEGLAPWEEMEWTGRTLRVGGAELVVREPIRRCKHTMANPVSGKRDADTLAVLEDTFGHQHFGMYCEVVGGGAIGVGDTAEVM